MFARLTRFLAVTVAVALLAACNSLTPKTFSKSDAKAIKTIGIINPINPKVYWYFDGGSPGKLFGAIGVLAESGIQNERKEQFDSMLKTGGFNFADELTLALIERLEAAGYAVVFIQSDRTDGGKFVRDYNALEKKLGADEHVDAYLDFAVDVIGYTSASPVDSELKPSIALDVQMVDRSGNQLYAQKFKYGMTLAAWNGLEIAAANGVFNNYEAMMKDPKKPLKAMRDGTNIVAQRISHDLKGSNAR